MKLITVSNRLPNSLVKGNNGWFTKKAVGGLSTALDSLLFKRKSVWIGWSGLKSKDFTAQSSHFEEWKKDGYKAIDIPTDLIPKFYDNYVNELLWVVHHNQLSYVEIKSGGWQAYKDANELFCQAVLEEYEDGDTVWVHDFQLMLLPKLLRQIKSDMKIGYFHHIPFPPHDIFEVIPTGDQLLSALLEADYVSFHTNKYADNFRNSVESYGIKDYRAEIGVNPIGIDCKDFQETLLLPEIQSTIESVSDTFSNKKLILAVERLDYMKGITERLKSYELFLENYPEQHGKVVLVQVGVSSRTKVETYKSISREIDRMVGRINGEFSTLEWSPVIYLNKSLSRKELIVLYNVADVLWINSLVDGMNLVCKEYILSKGQKDGILMLSKFAGAMEDLSEAVMINPYSLETNANKLNLILKGELGSGQIPRLQEKVLQTDVANWGNNFLSSLDSIYEKNISVGR